MTSSRRVLRTVPSYFPYVTGPANQARQISRGLVDYGFESSVVTTTLGAKGAPHHETLDGVEVLRFPIQMGFMQYHVALGALKALYTHPLHIIHVHSYRNFLADAAALVARARHIPLVLHLHGSLLMYKRIVRRSSQWIYGAYDRITRPLPTLDADRIIVSTRDEAGEAEQYGLDKRRISVIPMGIEPTQYDFADVSRDPQHIIFVGRLAEDRNVEQLIHALALLSDLPWSCTIVGGEERRSYTSKGGYIDRLRQLAIDLGVADRVDFTGPLNGEQLRRAYAEPGIFVYPSRYENFGQTILEAAASGCVLVTTRVGVANDLIQDGVTGFHVEHNVPEELAQRLRWLLEHPAKQTIMSHKLRAVVEQNYAWGPILQCYSSLYEDVIEEFRMSPGQEKNPGRFGKG